MLIKRVCPWIHRFSWYILKDPGSSPPLAIHLIPPWDSSDCSNYNYSFLFATRRAEKLKERQWWIILTWSLLVSQKESCLSFRHSCFQVHHLDHDYDDCLYLSAVCLNLHCPLAYFDLPFCRRWTFETSNHHHPRNHPPRHLTAQVAQVSQARFILLLFGLNFFSEPSDEQPSLYRCLIRPSHRFLQSPLATHRPPCFVQRHSRHLVLYSWDPMLPSRRWQSLSWQRRDGFFLSPLR